MSSELCNFMLKLDNLFCQSEFRLYCTTHLYSLVFSLYPIKIRTNKEMVCALCSVLGKVYHEGSIPNIKVV